MILSRTCFSTWGTAITSAALETWRRGGFHGRRPAKVKWQWLIFAVSGISSSKTAYDQAVTLAKDANVLEPTEGAGHEIREQNRRIRLAASNAFAVQTAFQFAQGNMAVALKNTQQALQLLIETASKEARKNGAPTGTQGPTPESDSALFRRLGRARLETVLELLLCLENLGQMLLIRGSPGEAELYFRRGLELSKSINSAPFQDKFHLCLAETDYRRLRLEDSGLHIKELNSSEEVRSSKWKSCLLSSVSTNPTCCPSSSVPTRPKTLHSDTCASATFLSAKGSWEMPRNGTKLRARFWTIWRHQPLWQPSKTPNLSMFLGIRRCGDVS